MSTAPSGTHEYLFKWARISAVPLKLGGGSRERKREMSSDGGCDVT